MNWIDDMRRPERTEEEIREHPLTFVLTLVFACVCAFGLIYIFAFSDTADEKWRHFYVVFALAALSGSCLAFAKKKEDRGALPIYLRRAIWGFILVCYGAALVFILKLGASPFTKFTDALRLFCYLGSTAPLAFISWQLFRSREKG